MAAYFPAAADWMPVSVSVAVVAPTTVPPGWGPSVIGLPLKVHWMLGAVPAMPLPPAAVMVNVAWPPAAATASVGWARMATALQVLTWPTLEWPVTCTLAASKISNPGAAELHVVQRHVFDHVAIERQPPDDAVAGAAGGLEVVDRDVLPGGKGVAGEGIGRRGVVGFDVLGIDRRPAANGAGVADLFVIAVELDGVLHVGHGQVGVGAVSDDAALGGVGLHAEAGGGAVEGAVLDGHTVQAAVGLAADGQAVARAKGAVGDREIGAEGAAGLDGDVVVPGGNGEYWMS